MQITVALTCEDRQWFENLIANYFNRMTQMSAELDALVAQVQANSDVCASAVTFIQGLGAQLADVQAQLAATGVTNAKLAELTAAMNASDASLGAMLNPPATP